MLELTLLTGLKALYCTVLQTSAAPWIDDETYWRRVCVDGHGWSRVELSAHGGCWKRMACERLAAQAIEVRAPANL